MPSVQQKRRTEEKIHILENDGQSHDHPAERAVDALAKLDAGLDDQKDHCTPEDDLESVDDEVGFVARPLLEEVDVLGEQLVGEKYK